MPKHASAQHDAHERTIQPPTTFLSLPPEIHQLIASQLPYPDLLALTLAHPTFRYHSLIRTSKSSRVEWLVDRAMRRLPLPSQSRCRWSSDKEFLSNAEVVQILRRRRQHLECAEIFLKGRNGGACLVVEGGGCAYLAENVEYLHMERWKTKLGLDMLRASGPLVAKFLKAGFKTLRSWQGAVLAVLLAAALWFLV